jgi:Zn-dependent peptidase ImmA (M78 family)
MKKLLLVLLFVPLVSFGQTKEGLQLCILSQDLSNNFSNSIIAEEGLNKILSVVSLAKNFTLVSCDKINNAEAWSYKGERYILYDKAFMKSINSKTNNWSNLTILAHEVGHHLNNHTIDLTMLKLVSAKSKDLKRKQELEADEFAGNIMAKLDAPLSEVL